MSNQSNEPKDFMSAKPQDIDDPAKLFTRWCWNEQTRSCIDGEFGACTMPDKKAETAEMLRQLATKIECGDSPIVTLIVVAAEFKKGNDADDAPPEDASNLGVDLIFQGQSPGLAAAAMMVAMQSEGHIEVAMAQHQHKAVEALTEKMKEIFGDGHPLTGAIGGTSGSVH